MRTTIVHEDTEFHALDRFIREPPTPAAEAGAAREAIDKLNRQARDTNRKARQAFVISVMD